MKNFLSNYKGTLILIFAIIVGALVGIFWKEGAASLKPFGDIFLNLMFIIIVPLIFFTITSSIAKMNSPKRLGKIMVMILVTFIVTSLVAVFVGLISTSFVKLVDVKDGEMIRNELSKEDEEITDDEDLSILERTVNVITVNDFVKLFSRDNLIALLLISVLVGFAINITGDSAKPLVDIIVACNAVLMNVIKLIMYYAPIGLGCYFASLVGTFGSEIAIGYARTFVIYTIVAILYYFII